MPSNGQWDFFEGVHKESRQADPTAEPQPRPNHGSHRLPGLFGHYVLYSKYEYIMNAHATAPDTSERIFIDTEFSAHASPYTFTGTATNTTYDSGYQLSKFDIEGTGTVDFRPKGPEVWKMGEELFEAKFNIVPGSGTGKYAGISGSGTLLMGDYERKDAYTTYYGYVLSQGKLQGSMYFENIVNGGEF
ncbi:MAG: hypothetical protein Q9226_005513 [Calogaya cf. arnoldii]